MHQAKKNILIVHQSSELYGSDKNILSLAKGIDKNIFHPIVVVPGAGPLEHELKRHGVECHVCDLIKISRATFTIKNLWALLWRIKSSIVSIDRAVDGRDIYLAHSNTLAVLSGAIWAKRRRIPHLWNVREMIVHPTIARYIFPLLLHIFSDRVVTNSSASRKLLVDALPTLARKSFVVWNGITRDALGEERSGAITKSELNIAEECTCVTLVGRINRWKGHDVFIKAANHLWEKGIRNIAFLMVGSPPPGQEAFETDLRQAIERSPAKKSITLKGYANDIWPIWDLTDIAVVPSTEPEPFGMVAIEAMLAGKPVIASNHGGLTEIVLPGITGELVPPNDYIALADSILKLASDNDYAKRLGDSGKQRAMHDFSMDSVIASFTSHYHAVAGHSDE